MFLKSLAGTPAAGVFAECVPVPGHEGLYRVWLSDAGREAVDRAIRRSPRPVRLLRRLAPGLYRAMLRLGHSPEDIDSICKEGIVRGFIRYDPAKTGAVPNPPAADSLGCADHPGLASAAWWGILGAINQVFRSGTRLKSSLGREVLSSHLWTRTDDQSGAMEPEDRSAQSDAGRAEIPPAAVLRWMRVLSPRERTAVRLRVMDQLPLHEVGQALGISKERARQVVLVALEKMRVWSGIDPGDFY